MSALAMILTAAMAVPGDGPEKVSGEMEQRIDLSGHWKGEWKTADGSLLTATSSFALGGSIECQKHGKDIAIRIDSVIDEGKGRFRLMSTKDQIGSLGIYKQDGDCLILCFRPARDGYPKLFEASFRADHGQHLLILHRVKTSK